MPRYADSERQSLADLLLTLGPDAPTINEGWETRHMAAHLVLRERRPDAAAGIMFRPLAGRTERLLQKMAAEPYDGLIARLRRPPRWGLITNPLVNELANGLEFLVHHEDVRRAQPDWQPRDLSPGHQAAVWKQLPMMARMALRRFPAAVVVHAPGHGEGSTGAGGEPVRLVGAPSELALFLMGRQRVARVQLTGSNALTERLRTTKLGN
ncbi:TIGR03085 family metal-binding protein [Micromonospora sp. NBC_01796]|uniref:TIGR03085 family metal-binding protein n=1 Tax=Micromonospora sp. NBC_01796 TaxID=2975987 RepID=UPI002DD83675|nr:TIGR03085 family metal-binding protein [Micromonospora sp. NBC_01796]WSA83480.1 TIGR03085 family metal-binding protein [Micromonospora sp. NBC_01796]